MPVDEFKLSSYVESVCSEQQDGQKAVEAACMRALVSPSTVTLSVAIQSFIEICGKDLPFENATGLFTKLLRICTEGKPAKHVISMVDGDTQSIALGGKFVGNFFNLILHMKWSYSFAGLVLDSCIILSFNNKISGKLFHKATESLFAHLTPKAITILVPRLLHVNFKDFYGSFCLTAHNESSECDIPSLLSWVKTISRIRDTRPYLKNSFASIIKNYSSMKPEAFLSKLVFALYLNFSTFQEVLVPLKSLIFSTDLDLKSIFLDSVKDIANLPSCTVQRKLLMNLSLELLSDRKYESSRLNGVKIGCKMLKLVYLNSSADELNVLLRDLVIMIESTAEVYKVLILKAIKKIFKRNNVSIMSEIDAALSIVSDFPNSEISVVLLNSVLPHMKSTLERKKLFDFLRVNFDLSSASTGFSSLKILLIILEKFKVSFDAAVISEHTQGIFTQTYDNLTEGTDQSSQNELLCLQVFGLVNRALNSLDGDSQLQILEGLYLVVRRNPGVAFPAARIMLKFAEASVKRFVSMDYETIAKTLMTDDGLAKFCLVKEIYRYCWLTYQRIQKFFAALEDDVSDRNMKQANTMQQLFEGVAEFFLHNNHEEFIRNIEENLTEVGWNQVFRTIIGILECWVCNVYQQKNKDDLERNRSVLDAVNVILKYQEALKKASISLKRNNECSYDALFVCDILHDIFCDSSDERQEPLAIFRNKEFVTYMLKSCQLILKKIIVSDKRIYSTSHCATFMAKISKFSSIVLVGLMDTVTAEQEYLVRCIDMLDCIILSMPKKSDPLAFYNFAITSGVIPSDKLENITDANKVYGDFTSQILSHFETYYRLQNVKACDGLVSIMQLAIHYIQGNSNEFSLLVERWTDNLQNLNQVTCKMTRSMMTFYFCLLKKQAKFEKTKQLVLLTNDLVFKLGDIEEEEGSVKESNVFTIVTEDNANDVYIMVLNHVSYVVSHILQKKVDMVARELNFERNGTCHRTKFEDMTQELNYFIKLGTKYAKLIGKMLKVKFNAMDTSLCENLLHFLISFYNMMNQFFKLFSGSAFDFDKVVVTLVRVTARRVVTQTYVMINHLESFRDSKNKKLKYDGVKASKMLSKTIPTLIFTIENYEKQLMAISKKRKVSLLKYFRHSTARDFKINLKMLEKDDEENIF